MTCNFVVRDCTKSKINIKSEREGITSITLSIGFETALIICPNTENN